MAGNGQEKQCGAYISGDGGRCKEPKKTAHGYCNFYFAGILFLQAPRPVFQEFPVARSGKVLEQAHQELRQARTTMELDEVLDRYYYRLDKHTVFNGDVPGNKRFMEMLEEKYERMG